MRVRVFDESSLNEVADGSGNETYESADHAVAWVPDGDKERFVIYDTVVNLGSLGVVYD